MKILVFRPDQLGDVILATPVFENLKNNYPDSEIISLTGTWTKKLLKIILTLTKIFFMIMLFLIEKKN